LLQLVTDKKIYNYRYAELGASSFFRYLLPTQFFPLGSLTLARIRFLNFPFYRVAQTLVAQPVVRWAKKG
jgi:hypothetical protein